MPNLVSLSQPSLQILVKTQTVVFSIYGFRVKQLINKNCHNSRHSNDIDMKLEPANKLDKKNTATAKQFDDDVMPANYDVIVIFSVYSRFRAIRKPDSRLNVYIY